MAASVVQGGFGIILRMNAVEVAEVIDLTPPAMKRDTFEATHHSSPNKWREFRKTLKDGGEVKMTINHLPANSTHNAATGLLSDFANDSTNPTFTLVFPDTAATTWTFLGIITEFAPKSPIDDRMVAEITIKVAGQPTLA